MKIFARPYAEDHVTKNALEVNSRDVIKWNACISTKQVANIGLFRTHLPDRAAVHVSTLLIILALNSIKTASIKEKMHAIYTV